MNNNNWIVPNYKSVSINSENKTKDYCVCIPVINEGNRIKKQLEDCFEKKIHSIADIIICDGGSTDDSLNETFLKQMHVNMLLVKTGPGKLSAQLRMGYSFALRRGYKGIVTIDGNNKDNIEAIFDFIQELEKGYDFIQGSRYLKGGKAINTPILRSLAVKFIHIPAISIMSGFKYSDTTNGFRGYSKNLLLSEKLSIFRDIFDTYELLAYISVKAPRYGFKVKEIPVIREYPTRTQTPTKIGFFKGNLKLLLILFNLLIHKYDPKYEK